MSSGGRWLLVGLAVVSILASPQEGRSATAGREEFAEARRWVAANLTGRGPESNGPATTGVVPNPIGLKPDQIAPAPFSFLYGGRPSAELVKRWKLSRQQRELDVRRIEHQLSWTDPDSGLEARCVAVAYRDFPTVEWTVYFRNSGRSDTPLLESIQSLDGPLGPGSEGEPVLHHFKGALADPDDYRPRQTVLGPGASVRMGTDGGRPCNRDLPYFNLAWPGGGVIVAVGWPGQWAASFARAGSRAVRVRAGQELTRFRLHPGEQVRTPLMVLQFWRGDRLESHNVWRRWMLAHSLPRPGGKLPPPLLVACSSHQFGEMIGANEENQKLFIDGYLAHGLKIDYWWMDAGWYKNDGTWVNVGTWEVDPKRFPRGLRAITNHAHSKGVKSIVWFEPERVTKGSWLYESHPEWLRKPADLPGPLAYQGPWRLLNLGDRAAWSWLVEHVDKTLRQQGIDLYRQDFNMDPLYFWRSNDAPDRQGITEIHYVTGYLAYWDELRRRHPDMLIDSCASGGRRNDLETLRRAVPLIRSDYLFEPTSQQCHTYGVSFWYPFHGTGTLVGPSKIFSIPTENVDPYPFRSQMAPNVTACWDVRRTDLDYAMLRTLSEQLRRIQPCYFGDYYPLTPYTDAADEWMAWQFNRPDLRAGMVQAFRRPKCQAAQARLKLRGLEPAASFVVTDLDAADAKTILGRDLTEQGLAVTLTKRPAAAVIVYQRQ